MRGSYIDAVTRLLAFAADLMGFTHPTKQAAISMAFTHPTKTNLP